MSKTGINYFSADKDCFVNFCHDDIICRFLNLSYCYELSYFICIYILRKKVIEVLNIMRISSVYA